MKRNIAFAAAGAVALVAAVGIYAQYDEWFVWPRLRLHVSSAFKDPANIQYRNERLAKSGHLCGELNAKNGHGAYTGFARFISRSAGEAYVDGIGYVGSNDRSTDEIIGDLDAKIEILKALKGATGAPKTDKPPSESEIQALTTKASFERRWSELCR